VGTKLAATPATHPHLTGEWLNGTPTQQLVAKTLHFKSLFKTLINLRIPILGFLVVLLIMQFNKSDIQISTAICYNYSFTGIVFSTMQNVPWLHWRHFVL